MRYDALHRAQLVQQLEPIASSSSRRFENWARTFTCTPRALFTPTTTHHARLALALARKDARVLRPVGIAHSPSDIAFTNDYLLDTSALTGLVAVDVNARHATFRAGTTLTAVHALLAPYGLAMRNLGSISDQTLAGIVATSTHGSGVRFGVMSTHVLSLTLLTPANCIAFCSRGVQPTQDAPWAPTIAPANVDLFEATVCGLGATGLILEITLELEPAFNLRDTHVVLPFNEFAERLDELKGRAEHVRFWWFPAVGRVRCSFANRTSEPARPPPPSLLHLHNSFLGFHLIQLLLLLTRYARPLPCPRLASISYSTPILTWIWEILAFLTSYTLHLLSRPLAWALRDAHVWAAGAACWAGGRGAEGLPAPRDPLPSSSSPLPLPSTTSSPSSDTGKGTGEEGVKETVVEGKNKKHEHEQGVNVDESWRVFNIECRYPQHTTEWALPAPRARACLAELAEWLEGERGDGEGERPHFPIEVRFSAADALWLSPSQGGETCWVGVVQYKPYNLPTRYRALFAAFERILAKHGGRPHWAKAHHLDARATRELYPDFGRFLRVVRDVDPEGTFRNEYIERHLFGGGGDGREYKARREVPSPSFSESSSTPSSSPNSTSSSSALPASASTPEEAEEDADADAQDSVEEKGESSRWWWPLPFFTKPKPKPTWRTDWRLPPPEAELRRRRERVALLDSLISGVSSESDSGLGLGSARSESDSGSDSESEGSEGGSEGSETLAGSVGDVHVLAGAGKEPSLPPALERVDVDVRT